MRTLTPILIAFLVAGAAGLRTDADAAGTLSRILPDDLETMLEAERVEEAEGRARSALAAAEVGDPVGRARALGVVAATLVWQGPARAGEAVPYARESVTVLQAYGVDGEPLELAVAGLARALYRADSLAAALPEVSRLIGLQSRIHGARSEPVAESLILRARCQRRLADLDGALASAREAHAIRQEIHPPDDPLLAETLNQIAVVASRQGDLATAEEANRQALVTRRAAFGDTHPDVAQSLHNVATNLLQQGRYAECRELFVEAIDIYLLHEEANLSALGRSYNNLGIALRRAGDSAAARHAYERTMYYKERVYGPDHPSMASTYTNLAILLTRLGQPEEAARLLERSRIIVEASRGADHPRVAQILTAQAKLLLDRDLARADTLAARAEAINVAALGETHPDVAHAASLRGQCALRQGRPEEGLAHFERAHAIRSAAFGPRNPILTDGLHELGIATWRLGDHARGLEMVDEAARVLAEIGLEAHQDRASALTTSARLHGLDGHLAVAVDAALEATEIELVQLDLTFPTLTEHEALALATRAAAALELAVGMLGRMDPPDPGRVRRAHDLLVKRRARVLDAIASRHRELVRTDDPEVRRRVASWRDARGALAAVALEGPGEDPDGYRVALDDARATSEAAERALADASTRFRDRRVKEDAGLDEVLAARPAGWALVSILRLEAGRDRRSWVTEDSPFESPVYTAFVVPAGDDEPVFVPLGSARELDGMLDAWVRALASGRDDPTAGGHEVRERVWDPLVAAMGAADGVFVVPDGQIQLVNLGALPLDDGRYLVEAGPVVHLLSAERDLIPVEGEVADGFLAVGGAAFDRRPEGDLATGTGDPGTGPRPEDGSTIVGARLSADVRGLLASGAGPMRGNPCAGSDRARFEPLPGSAAEVQELARIWRDASGHDAGEVRVLSGVAASERAVKATASQAAVIHLATHGFFLDGPCHDARTTDSTRGIGGVVTPSDEPWLDVSGPREIDPRTVTSPLLRAGLAFAGANLPAPDLSGDDGVLTAEEIGALDLTGASWVVLSACDTGRGEVRAGEGVFGLRRAVHAAGARSLVMSLWPVDDAATRRFMSRLYRARFAEGLNTATALREATRRELAHRRSNGLSDHPFHWAGFVAEGSWR